MARMDIPTQRRGIVGTGGVRRAMVTGVINQMRVYVRVPRLYEDADLEASVMAMPRELVVGDRVFVASVEGRWDSLVVIGLDDVHQGFAGAVPTASDYHIVGPGRPDVISSTGGLVSASTPVGATYVSNDGAGVGAFVWRKRPGGTWVVTEGDTGWLDASALLDSRWSLGTRGSVQLRRTPQLVEVAIRNVNRIGADTSSLLLSGVPTEFTPPDANVKVPFLTNAVLLIRPSGRDVLLQPVQSVIGNEWDRQYASWPVRPAWPSTLAF